MQKQGLYMMTNLETRTEPKKHPDLFLSSLPRSPQVLPRSQHSKRLSRGGYLESDRRRSVSLFIPLSLHTPTQHTNSNSQLFLSAISRESEAHFIIDCVLCLRIHSFHSSE